MGYTLCYWVIPSVVGFYTLSLCQYPLSSQPYRSRIAVVDVEPVLSSSKPYHGYRNWWSSNLYAGHQTCIAVVKFISPLSNPYPGYRTSILAVEPLSLLSNPHRRRRTDAVVGGHMIRVVACHCFLCWHLVLVMALFITLALGIELSDRKG